MATDKKTMAIAREVIAGDWGSGQARVDALRKKGYNPEEIQTEVNRRLCCRELIIQNIRAWAIKTAAEDYRYIFWTEPYGHECAKCHPHGGKNLGWQCIGWVIACWHHGGLPIPCNCGVLDNGTMEKILKAKTDADALKIAQKALKIKEIKVIRNGGKVIPKEKVQPGDIGGLFTGTEFQHLILLMGDGKVSDSTRCKNKADDIRADRKLAGRYVSRLKVLIRYTGNGLTTPAKKSVDELAREVIAGGWGSGDSRKLALTQCGYDYNAVQKRVNEILSPKQEKKAYTGKLPTMKLVKTNAEVIADAIRWAVWIAGDNRFHYGHGKDAHHNGCFFCKTQPKSKKKAGIVDYERTYCCNPFVGAAWAHGGCDQAAMKLCSKGTSWDFHKGRGYDKSTLFKNLGKPAKSKLKAGDVLCSDTHVALYIGAGKLVEAGGGDDNVRNSKKWNNSIRVRDLTDKKYASFKRMHRYIGSVNAASVIIRHGEISNRVALMQEFLVWYGALPQGETADGIYGDKTLAAVKKFQTDMFGAKEADGLVGPKTIAAMASVKK